MRCFQKLLVPYIFLYIVEQELQFAVIVPPLVMLLLKYFHISLRIRFLGCKFSTWLAKYCGVDEYGPLSLFPGCSDSRLDSFEFILPRMECEANLNAWWHTVTSPNMVNVEQLEFHSKHKYTESTCTKLRSLESSRIGNGTSCSSEQA